MSSDVLRVEVGHDRGFAGGVDLERRRVGARRAPAHNLYRDRTIGEAGRDTRRADRHVLIGALVADVQLDEEHVFAFVEARGLDAGELAQLELQIVEGIHSCSFAS